MNLNIQANCLVYYKPCVKCKKGLSKENELFCKHCKPKREYNRALCKSLSKVYLNKFDINNSSYGKEHVKMANIPGSKHIYLRFRLNKEISYKTNTKTSALFFSLYWDQFNSFNDFSNFITKSLEVSPLYFMYNSITIQQKPRIQQFVISRQDQLPVVLITNQPIPVPISRPILLLVQESYWSSLIASYFKHIHIVMPIFSIHSISFKTVTKPLLSAIFYGGFQYMQDKPPELVKYFNEYSERNIKEATRVISLQNAQALFLYSFIMVILGNFKLFRACQAHAIRMSYALGLHLNSKTLNPLQRYNRLQFFFNTCAIHIFLYGMGNLSLNQLTELGDCNTDLMDPKYQTPNSNCIFSFDTEDENIVYGICTNISLGLNYMQSRYIFDLSKCSKYLIQSEFEAIFINSTQKYYESISKCNSLLQKYQHLKLSIQTRRINLTLAYRTGNLEMYAVLRYRVNNLTPCQISKMLYECVKLFNTIIESQGICQILPAYPYIAGLNFIILYQIANLHEKILIKEKLSKLLDYLSKGPTIDKLSYLIIKKEYEIILRTK